MSVLSSRPVLRWLIPATAAAAVIGGGAAVATVAGAADPALPERSAAQLLVDLQTARLDGLSGTVVQRADLGLPPIANLAGLAGGDNLLSLASGQHTLRVWYAGPDKTRVSLVGNDAQTDVIRDGEDAWFWNSRSKEATHAKLGSGDQHPTPPTGFPATPQEAADLALKAIEPSTQVTVSRTVQVAGRDAYELSLSPRDTASLIGQISVAIDAEEHVPLRVRVFPPGSDDTPAFEAAFTMVSFDRPDDAQFTFNPPPGTKINEADADAIKDHAQARHEPPASAERPQVVGSGWTSVVVAKLDKPAGASAEGAPDVTALLGQLPAVSGSWGSGHLLTTRLATVLVTDDGRIIAGLVTPEKLYEVAATTK